MSYLQRTLAVIAAGGIAWGLASWWCANPSECFYIAVPPVALVIFLTGFPDFREALRTQLRPVLTVAAGLLVAGVGLAGLFFGPIAVFSVRYWVEVGTADFTFSPAWSSCSSRCAGCSWRRASLYKRWHGSPALRLVLCELLPLAAFHLLRVAL